MMPVLHKSCFEGRNPPSFIPNSQAEIDWWQEQMNRICYGYSYKGSQLSGANYFFLNFMKIKLIDTRTNTIDFSTPYYSTADHWLYDQAEEAKASMLNMMLLTAGGFGKSYLATSFALTNYLTTPLSQTIISASYDVPADNLMAFIKDANDVMPKHLSQPFLQATNEYLLSGFKNKDSSVNPNSYKSEIWKLIFGDNSGALRSLRPDIHIFEEIGNWIGSAGLIDCYNACQARYRRGIYTTCFALLIGTGGKVKAKAAKDLRTMYYDAALFNLKSVELGPEGRPKAFFMPVFKKYVGFFEFKGDIVHPISKEVIGNIKEDGHCDEEAVKNYKQEVRDLKAGNLKAFIAETSEFPFTEEEMFQAEGGAVFVTKELLRQYQEIAIIKSTPKPIICNLFPILKDGIIIGVDIDENKNGKVHIYELPVPDLKLKYKDLYCAGYDGIDLGKKDTESGEGSDMAMIVKKRFATDKDTNNKYVAEYLDRPNDVEDGYEQCSLLMILYQCMTNIEFSKIGIVPFLEKRRLDKWLMKRPLLTIGDGIQDKDKYEVGPIKLNNNKVSKLIGTLPTDTNFGYGVQFLQRYIKQYYFNIHSERFSRGLLDYTNEKRGLFDLVVAAMMCEIGDESLGIVSVNKEIVRETILTGYYTDEYGIKRFGKIPTTYNQMQFTKRS